VTPRRAVLVFAAGCDPTVALAWLVRLVPGLERLRIVVWASVRSGWWTQSRWAQTETRLAEGAAALQEAATGGPSQIAIERCDIDGDIVIELSREAITASIERARAELVVWGPLSPDSGRHDATHVGRLLLHVSQAARLPQLVVAPTAPPADLTRVACPYLGDVGQLAPLGPLLRRFGLRDVGLTLLGLSSVTDDAQDPVDLARAAGLGRHIAHQRLPGGLIGAAEQARQWLTQTQTQLVAVTLPTTAPLASLLLPLVAGRATEALAVPMLIAASTTPESSLALSATDLLVRKGRPLRLCVEESSRLGGPLPFSGELAAELGTGRPLPVSVDQGRARLPSLSPSLTTLSLIDTEPGTPVAVAGLRICRAHSVDLVDASLNQPLDAVARLQRDAPAGRAVVVVRVDPATRLDQLRARLPGVLILDATMELDDGAETDLPSRSHSLRLVRLAKHLDADGVSVDRVAMSAPATLAAPGIVLWSPAASIQPPRARPDRIIAPCTTVGQRLDRLCATRVRTGCATQVELDNGSARRRWLALIDGARLSVHVQFYIVEADAVAEQILAALARAATRGVQVRVLVDSVATRMKGSGSQNPLILRLSEVNNIELREHRPLSGLPGIDDLKLRCHRKLLTIDGRVAIVTGRNLGAPYLQGFDEVLVTPSLSGGALPWLDAGVRVEGPVVQDVEAAFLASWVQARGHRFALPTRTLACGPASVRLVLHDGMRDAHTVDAYRTLIDQARTSLWLANTFPLQQELLRALLRALRRGVTVSILVGNVRPVYGQRVPFPHATSVREVATQVIHGRLDALARAGAVVGELAMTDLPGWDPTAGPVRPHVHAKLMVADERWTAVGSANLDVTAGYWESEVLAIIDSYPTAADTVRKLRSHLDHSVPFDPSDPGWQVLAQRRAWLSANWPSLVG